MGNSLVNSQHNLFRDYILEALSLFPIFPALLLYPSKSPNIYQRAAGSASCRIKLREAGMSTTLSSLDSKLAMSMRVSMSFSIARVTILVCCLALCSSSCTITCTENITDFYNSGFVTVIEEGRLVCVGICLFNLSFLDSNYTGPMNTIGYVSNNVAFSASVPFSCHFRLYQNTCLCSNLENVILHSNGTNYLRYTILNLTLPYNEMRIDVCAQCGNNFKCFHPVYLIVKGKSQSALSFLSYLFS